MNNSTKITLVAAAIGIIGLGGLAKIVSAAQSQPQQVAIMPQQTGTKMAEVSDGDGEANDATEVSVSTQPSQLIAKTSVRNQVAEASDGDGETNDDVKDQQESAKLQPLAKITSQQAQQTAEQAGGGKASNVKLENEDGNLIYAVVIGQQEVKVDAGNGKILYTDKVGNEQNEGVRPRSSIQVTQAGGDGDGETNDDG